MFTLVKKYKREFVYSSYLFLVFELLLTPAFVFEHTIYLLTVGVGAFLIASCLFHLYGVKGVKKVSKYSDVLMRINLKERLFTHVLLPFLFYTSVVSFLYFSANQYMNQLVVIGSSTLFFYLFLHIKSSYEKAFYISKTTKVVYDLITITTFFLVVSVIVNLGIPFAISGWLIFLTSFVSLIYMLYLNNKFAFDGVTIAVLSSLLVTAVAYYMWQMNIFVIPAVTATTFYAIVSIWHVRFSGSRSLDDYIPPLMYTLMILILIFSL